MGNDQYKKSILYLILPDYYNFITKYILGVANNKDNCKYE